MNDMNNKMHQGNVTLVLGGTGKTGHRVVERLISRNVPVRIGARSGKLPFDWLNKDTWTPALQNVKSIYIVYYPDLAVPGAADAIRSFTDLAVQYGVQRLVLLSGRGEEEAQKCEHIVQNAGAKWTILRSSWFCQNFSEGFLREMVLTGEVALPAGTVVEPFIDVEDIADIAVAALTEDGHDSQLYELTGPRLLSFTEAVDEIALETGRSIRYRQIPSPVFTAALAEQEVPADTIALMNYLFNTVLDGRNAHLTNGVYRALGRQPRDFSTFVKKAATSDAWQELSIHHD